MPPVLTWIFRAKNQIMTPEEIVSELGFNALESEVYVALLKHGPQTAYKIGKLLNRPTANVYKAVDVLAESGAIEVEESDVKVCRAIPVKTLAKQLQQRYKQKIDRAVERLGNLRPETNEEGIYRLHTVEAVLERVDEMLKRAAKVVVVDSFPLPLERVRESLARLVSRRVDVYVEAYDDVRLPKGILVSVPAVGSQSLEYWNAQQLNISVDGKEMLVALFNADLTEVIQATYSNNTYLSSILFLGLMSEHRLHRFMQVKSLKELEAIKRSHKYAFNSQIPGIESLLQLYKKE